MKFRVRNRFRHDCDLSQEQKLGIHSPYDSWLKSLWYKVRLRLTVSKHHESIFYFRSIAAFNKERKRHLETPSFKFIIHPFSPFARRKATIVSFIWFLSFIMETFVGSFLSEEFHSRTQTPITHKILMFINLSLLVDVCFRFLVGYPVEATRVVVLEPRSIALKYLKTYFIFDVGALLGYGIYSCFNLNKKGQLLMFELHHLRLARLATMFANMEGALRNFRFRQSTRNVIIMIITGFTILHGLTCFLALIPVYKKAFDVDNSNSWLVEYDKEYEKRKLESAASTYTVMDDLFLEGEPYRKYMVNLCMVMCHFFGCGTYRYSSKDAFEMLTLAVILHLGIIFYVYVVAKILQLFGVVNISETKFEELRIEATQYMIRKHFPADLRKRICKYYDYRFNKKFFSEHQILDTLSEHLRMEVLLYSCRNLIGEVQMFKGLSKSAVGSVLALLKPEIYIANDEILPPDDESGDIYFILYGTCAIQLTSGKEIMHIEDGDHFGDTSAFETVPPVKVLFSIISLEVSEVYKLEKQDIRYCCRTYPEIYYKLQAMAMNRTKRYNEMVALRGDEDQSDSDTADDIIHELRKGRILRAGIQRQVFS